MSHTPMHFLWNMLLQHCKKRNGSPFSTPISQHAQSLLLEPKTTDGCCWPSAFSLGVVLPSNLGLKGTLIFWRDSILSIYFIFASSYYVKPFLPFSSSRMRARISGSSSSSSSFLLILVFLFLTIYCCAPIFLSVLIFSSFNRFSSCGGILSPLWQRSH